LQIPEDSGKYWLYQYCRYWKTLENTGYTSIADTGKYWLYQYNQYFPESSGICNTHIFGNDQYLLVLQILEDSGILVFTSICISIADTGRFW
jgi:hypothetical protein